MTAADCFGDFHAGVNIQSQPNVVPASLVGREITHDGLLARNIHNVACHRSHTTSRARRLEARSDDHREDELVPAVSVGERVEILDGHVDGPARLDVGNGLREDIWPFLSEQSSDIALAFGLGVNLLRLLAFANDAPDAPLTDG